jgi:hypothetical protein
MITRREKEEKRWKKRKKNDWKRKTSIKRNAPVAAVAIRARMKKVKNK